MQKLCLQSMLAFGLLWANVPTLAAEPPHPTDVCVRNFFPEGSGMNPCESNRTIFRDVLSSEEQGKTICTKSYEDKFCSTASKEYRYVEAADGEVICTVNFHQEGIAEYCYSSPKIFSWAKGQ